MRLSFVGCLSKIVYCLSCLVSAYQHSGIHQRTLCLLWVVRALGIAASAVCNVKVYRWWTFSSKFSHEISRLVILKKYPQSALLKLNNCHLQSPTLVRSANLKLKMWLTERDWQKWWWWWGCSVAELCNGGCLPRIIPGMFDGPQRGFQRRGSVGSL